MKARQVAQALAAPAAWAHFCLANGTATTLA
jgi:hypothetical protein